MPGRTRARGCAPTPRRSSQRAAAAPMPPTPTATTRHWGRARSRDQGAPPREAPQLDSQANIQHSLQDFLSLVRREVQQGLQPATESQAHQPIMERQATHPPPPPPPPQCPAHNPGTFRYAGVRCVSKKAACCSCRFAWWSVPTYIR